MSQTFFAIALNQLVNRMLCPSITCVRFTNLMSAMALTFLTHAQVFQNSSPSLLCMRLEERLVNVWTD